MGKSSLHAAIDQHESLKSEIFALLTAQKYEIHRKNLQIQGLQSDKAEMDLKKELEDTTSKLNKTRDTLKRFLNRAKASVAERKSLKDKVEVLNLEIDSLKSKFEHENGELKEKYESIFKE